jgi:hypothetical protein
VATGWARHDVAHLKFTFFIALVDFFDNHARDARDEFNNSCHAGRVPAARPYDGWLRTLNTP